MSKTIDFQGYRVEVTEAGADVFSMPGGNFLGRLTKTEEILPRPQSTFVNYDSIVYQFGNAALQRAMVQS